MLTGEKQVFTCESVAEGHPDKVCDQVSDAVLDAVLEEDPHGRVACETLVTRGLIFISGEITAQGTFDIPAIARQTISEIGYNDPEYGFSADGSAVLTAIQKQSPDIAQGVDTGGAGDQGMMFGYACDETEELMPLPFYLAQQLVRRLAEVRRQKIVPYLRPDGKSQVSAFYEGGKARMITTIVLAAQHDPGIKQEGLKEDLVREVIRQVVPEGLCAPDMKIIINRTGSFVLGGPRADTGLTGRKIIVDTYGGFARHGGGCFSGKDPSKVDRSASYMARYLAKNIIAAQLAGQCEIQLAYAIGEPQPVSLNINTFGTGVVPEDKIQQLVRDNFDLSPGGIIKKLDLLKPRYRKTACYGHFGRKEPEFTWEARDAADLFKTLL